MTRTPATETDAPAPTPRVAVLGAGTMGRGIAQLALQAGCSVVLVDARHDAATAALAALGDLFTSLAAKGRLAAAPQELLARVTLGHAPAAASGSDWVVEAVPEDLALKRELFAELATVAPTARLATNTSTLSVTAIAAGCSRPGDVIGMHFFNPPGLMRLVEVVPGAATRPDLVREAVAFVRLLAREPVVTSDSPGFIVNRLARPFYLEALRLHAEGVDVALCDEALRSAGFAMGPFELIDLIGLDVNLASSESVYQAFYQEPRFRPHPLQRRMVDAGLLGRKVGRGFYRYDEAGRRLPAESGEAAVREPHQVRRSAGTDGVSVTVVGAGAVADSLRARLHEPPREGPSAAPAGGATTVVLDATVTPPPDAATSPHGAPVARAAPAEVGGPAAARVPVGTSTGDLLLALAWGRSASAAAGPRHGQSTTDGPGPAVLGFSLVPGARRPGVDQAGADRTDADRTDADRTDADRTGADQTGADRPGTTGGTQLTIELLVPDTAAAVDAAERAAAALTTAGCRVLLVPDQPGGIAFRVVALLVNEAVAALAEGLASRADLDTAMRLGVNYPLGPLEWAERLGLTAVCAALDGLHQETGAARFAPHPLLRRLVAIGATTFPATQPVGPVSVDRSADAPQPSRSAGLSDTMGQ